MQDQTTISSQQERKGIFFGDWVIEDNSKVDDEIVERHLDSVIEALYKRYKGNQDGFLTPKEFQEIAANLNLMDNFADIDMDQDGLISKSEMKEYYLQSNCQALKLGFKHNFEATTFTKPTFCRHCTGLIYGLVKQGLKCKDCGVNTHHRCKGLLTIDCSRTASEISKESSCFSRFRSIRKSKRNQSDSIEGTATTSN